MQDRYVGDVGDFAKYALLRFVAGHAELRLGLVWCRFRNESHNSDGRHTSYLEDRHFYGLDTRLHATLAKIVKSRHRSIRKIAKSGLFPLTSIFFDTPISQS